MHLQQHIAPCNTRQGCFVMVHPSREAVLSASQCRQGVCAVSKVVMQHAGAMKGTAVCIQRH